MKELIENLGYDVALTLCTFYGGCTLYIPNAKGLKLAQRNQRIKSDRLAGAEINQLAINYQLSDRQICSILK